MIMRKISAIAAALTLGLAAFAQNGNHTVEVTNDYVTHMAGLQKTGVEMAVPDSLLHFDYKFDYSVFETPYKGAYEFSPYHIHVQPQASAYDAGKFYLRAGAGYSIRPVLDFVVAAVTKPEFSLSVYNEGRGFYGRNAGNPGSVYAGEGFFKGYDASDRFGIGARWIRPKFEAKLDLGYDLIAAGDELKWLNSMAHSGFAKVDINPVGTAGFDYKFNAKVRYTSDSELDSRKAGEVLAGIGGRVGFAIGDAQSIAFDFLLDNDTFKCDDVIDTSIAIFGVTPSYNFNKGAFAIKAGAKLDYSTAQHFTVAPDVRISAKLLKDKLIFYAGADGGQSLFDQFSMKSAFHRATIASTVPGVNKELIHGYVGFDGHAGHIFEWGLRAGYHNWKEAMFESLTGFGNAHLSMLYVDGRFALRSERVDFDGDFRIAKSDLMDPADVFCAPLASGNMRLVYNRNRRIFAGIWAQAQTARDGFRMEQPESIPGWVNLGVSAEYKAGTKWGLWLEAGNLLCQELWFTPLCAEKDPYATLGISLKF